MEVIVTKALTAIKAESSRRDTELRDSIDAVFSESLRAALTQRCAHAASRARRRALRLSATPRPPAHPPPSRAEAVEEFRTVSRS